MSLTVITELRSFQLPAGQEPDLMAALARELDPLFAAPRAGPERTGLYVATSNAGTASSVEFWAEAQRRGVGLASPELFPWCLANAPCGWLAKHFEIRGPNATYLGHDDAWAAAMRQAEADLHSDRVEDAFVIRLDTSGRSRCCAARVVRG